MAHRILNLPEDVEAFAVLWHPAPGYSFYEITRDGRVRSLPRLVNSPATGGQRRVAGKELTVQLVKGYPAFLARTEDGRKTTAYLHRLIAMLFVPNPESRPHVNHIDGDKTNNDPSNLEWVTHAENMRHAFETGLTPLPKSGPGEKSPAAKLNWKAVTEIRRRLGEGESQSDIARQLNLSKGTIGFIARNETWRVDQ